MLNHLKTALLSILWFAPLVLSAQYSSHRRVLIFTDTETNATLMQQKHILASDEAGCIDRDMVVETYVWNKTDRKFLTKYGISSAPFTFLLIGKDGHVALRSFKIISKAQLFALIDGMPMRRDEMKRKRQ